MKQFYFLLLICLPILSLGQCPQGNVILTSQSDIDNFDNTYPSCTNIQGFLIINGNDVVDLSPLSQINSVGSILIAQTSLLNMQGLEAITITGLTTEDSFIVVDDNPLLQDILFLNNYTVNVPVVFLIRDMPLLTSLEGAGNITNFVTLYLENNDTLTSLDALNQNLNIVGGMVQPPFLYIADNAILSDISRLNTAQVNDAISAEITNNSQLALCDNNLVCAIVTNGNATIDNNAPGCESTIEVALTCGIVPENDECTDAYEVEIGIPFEAYSNYGTSSAQVPSCNDLNRVDVWFTFNTGSLDSVDILVNAGYHLQLWTGNCTNLMQVPNGCSTISLYDIPVNQNTDYYVQVWSIDSGGGSGPIFEIVVENAILSVEENVFERFSMFPNPVNNNLNLVSEKSINEVQLYSLFGQHIRSFRPNSAQVQFDMSQVNSGMYILLVTIGEQTETYKIVKL